MRKTKIVCTLGPASESEEMIRQLMLEGMNVARFNFSHGDHEEQLRRLQIVKKVRITLTVFPHSSRTVAFLIFSCTFYLIGIY